MSDQTSPAPHAEEDSLPEQMRVRREKRERLLESGRSAYPLTVERTHSLKEIRAKYDPLLVDGGLEPDTRTGEQVAVVGRAIFLRNTGKGWVTAEYAMLPRATSTRTQRDSAGKISGRSQEIQRLIGRALRGVVDTSKIGDRTITVDCDVLQADGGTRTASITGGYVALVLALRKIGAEAALDGQIAAVSVGIVDAVTLLDLDYSEDSHAEVDFNVVGTNQNTYVEVQGTAEGKPFDRAAMDRLLELADGGLQQLFRYQRTVLGLE